MRFSTILISSVFAALSVNAQSNGTATITSALVSGTEGATPAQESATQCLKTCKSLSQNTTCCCVPNNHPGADSDSQCRADCQLLANSVNPIANCQSLCPKGNGTAIDNKNYEECYQACISTAAETPTPAPGSQKTTTKGGAEATNSPSKFSLIPIVLQGNDYTNTLSSRHWIGIGICNWNRIGIGIGIFWC